MWNSSKRSQNSFFRWTRYFFGEIDTFRSKTVILRSKRYFLQTRSLCTFSQFFLSILPNFRNAENPEIKPTYSTKIYISLKKIGIFIKKLDNSFLSISDQKFRNGRSLATGFWRWWSFEFIETVCNGPRMDRIFEIHEQAAADWWKCLICSYMFRSQVSS